MSLYLDLFPTVEWSPVSWIVPRMSARLRSRPTNQVLSQRHCVFAPFHYPTTLRQWDNLAKEQLETKVEIKRRLPSIILSKREMQRDTDGRVSPVLPCIYSARKSRKRNCSWKKNERSKNSRDTWSKSNLVVWDGQDDDQSKDLYRNNKKSQGNVQGLFLQFTANNRTKIVSAQTLYVLIFSFLFLVSEFFISSWLTMPNTCSMTASWRKSSLPYTGTNSAQWVKQNAS